ncbi:molybdopterin molybdenumtransferase MoeA, partial [Streptomyces sp. NPDC059762]
MPWTRARDVARNCVEEALPAVTRDIADALGHALAEPLTALTDLPSFHSSAMDGWAVAGAGPWRLRPGRVLAGASAGPLAPGTAVAIATGAPLPDGSCAVLRREHGEVTAGHELRYGGRGPLPEGCDVRPPRPVCRPGDPLLPPGAPVTPAGGGGAP